MSAPKVYHYTLTADVPYTFTFDVKGIDFLVKNFTQSNLKVSYGDAIDAVNYILVPTKTGELISSSPTDNTESKTESITVESSSGGDVEIRILGY